LKGAPGGHIVAMDMLSCASEAPADMTTLELSFGAERQREVMPQAMKETVRYEGGAMLWYKVDLKCSVSGIQWKPPAGSEMNYLTSGHMIDYEDLRNIKAVVENSTQFIISARVQGQMYTATHEYQFEASSTSHRNAWIKRLDSWRRYLHQSTTIVLTLTSDPDPDSKR